jgi:hypothetical protein
VLGAFHDIAVAHVGVLDVGKTQRSTAILVTSEFSYRCVSRLISNSLGEHTNRRLCVGSLLEFNHTGSARATVGLVLNLGTFDLSNRGEELDEILVASRPW